MFAVRRKFDAACFVVFYTSLCRFSQFPFFSSPGCLTSRQPFHGGDREYFVLALAAVHPHPDSAFFFSLTFLTPIS